MSNRIITLLSDFGIQDGYVASMKGIMLGICPNVRLVDISHMVPPQDIRAGAFILATVFKDFPRGTTHLAVVDPGVGTERKAIAVKTPSYFFVGPDNGLFTWALLREDRVEARCIENPKYLLSGISSTFHGRDVFAPVAAHLAKGIEFSELGTLCTPCVSRWSAPVHGPDGIHGEVIYIDRFGNAVTNVDRLMLRELSSPGSWTVHVKDHLIRRIVLTYGDEAPGTLMALVGSSGYLEIAINQGNAAVSYEIRTGDPVSLIPDSGRPPSIVQPA